MSFILDALKKSEQERERQQAPQAVDIPYGRRQRGQPLWLWLVLGLLLLNCVLLLVMWWRGAHPTSLTANTASTAVTSTSSNASSSASINAPAAARLPMPMSRPAEVRPLQAEANNETEAPTDETTEALASDPLPADTPLVRPLTGVARAAAEQESFANSQRANSPGSFPTTSNGTDSTPTLASLGGNGVLNLPEMRLDVHVYSSVASERFAFINSRKYVEGQTLSEGPRVEKIAQDGVILSYRNQRFLLPRQ